MSRGSCTNPKRNFQIRKREIEEALIAICPHCETRWTWKGDKWEAVIKRHGRHCGCPKNWICTLCNKPIANPSDFAEWQFNGAHPDCAVRELFGDEWKTENPDSIAY